MGYLVSRSLTLSSAHVHTVGGIRHADDYPHWPKRKANVVLRYISVSLESFIRTQKAFDEDSKETERHHVFQELMKILSSENVNFTKLKNRSDSICSTILMN